MTSVDERLPMRERVGAGVAASVRLRTGDSRPARAGHEPLGGVCANARTPALTSALRCADNRLTSTTVGVNMSLSLLSCRYFGGLTEMLKPPYDVPAVVETL
jgi:hypothetical protein